MPAASLEIRDLTVEYASQGGYRVRPLDGLTETCHDGELVILLGPSGSGKTTLLSCLAGLLRPTSGEIVVGGREVTGLEGAALADYRRHDVGIVFQAFNLIPSLTARENVAAPLRLAGTPWGEAERRADELLGDVDLRHRLRHKPAHMSGGQQQRVAIARALAPRPKVLLLDEPLAAVDPATRTMLRRELRALHEREGITTLQVTHDFDDALRMGDLVAVLAEGRVVQSGRPEAVFRRPNSAFVAHFVGAGNVLAGEVTHLGETTDDGRFKARFTSGTLELELVAEREGPAHVVIRPEDLLLSLGPPPASLRNRLPARVERLERLGPVTHVHLVAGRPLAAAVTNQTADELDLRPGATVWIGLKATAILLV
jgi:molybdopterin-binding protein